MAEAEPVRLTGFLLQEDKKKDGGAAAAAGGVSLQLQSFDELNQKIASLEQEKNKEGEYRNYMQLERVRWPMILPLCAILWSKLATALAQSASMPAGQNQRLLGDHQEGP